MKKLFLAAALLLAASARASVLEIQVPVSPSAGASYISNTIVIAPAVLKVNGGEVTGDVAGYVGAQSTWQWGPNYGLGLTLGVVGQGISSGNVDLTSVQGKLAGGVAVDWIGVEAAAVWSNDGARLVLTKPF